MGDTLGFQFGLSEPEGYYARACMNRTLDEDAFAIVFDAMPALVIYKDTKNQILRVNQAVADSFGITPDEMRGTHSARWYPDEAERYYADDLEVIHSDRPKLGIIEAIEVAGEKRWFQTDKFPTHARDGSVNGVVLMAQDVTERRLLEEQVQHSQRMESVGRLAGGIAHDFNNVLTAIGGFAELAEMSVAGGLPVDDSLEQVQAACQRAGYLTRQLLVFARKEVPTLVPTDLDELLRRLSGILNSAIREDIRIHMRLGGNANVLVDRGQFEQVVLNLALNARDAMPRGGDLTLTTELAQLSPEQAVKLDGLSAGPHFKLSLTDTGVGIEPEQLDCIFEPFFTTKPPGEGTGLGLSVCFSIVQQHSGLMTVTSKPGQGARFELFFPVTCVEAVPLASSRKAVAAAMRGNECERVLLVEDEPLVRAVSEVALRDAGYTVVAAGDGNTAISLANTSAFDVLVADVVMPSIGGEDLAFRLVREGSIRAALLISGYSQVELDHEESDWPLLNKPFTPHELCAEVRRLLDASTLPQPSVTA